MRKIVRNLAVRSAKGALRRLRQNLPEDEDISSVLQKRVKMIKYECPFLHTQV